MKRNLLLSALLFWVVSGISYAQNPGEVITLDLSKPLNPEAIEYTEKGCWTETYNDEDYSYLEFEKFAFSHIIHGYGFGQSWDGFTICNSGDKTNYGAAGSSGSWITDQWGCMAGGGIKTDATGKIMKDEQGNVLVEKGIPYLVTYWSSFMEMPSMHNAQVIFTEQSYEVQGVYVCNHPWPYYGNQNGDGFARALDQEGDYFKIIFHGLDEEYADTGVTVEHFLTQCIDGEVVQSDKWEYVDLSALGEVSGFYCTMETTDVGQYGPNTATYFCMDKVQVKVPTPPVPQFTVTIPADAELFLGKKDGNKHYIPFIEYTANNITVEDGNKIYSFDVPASSTKMNYRVSQAGKISYADIVTIKSTEDSFIVTSEQLQDGPKYIDRDVSNNGGYNMADIYLNINKEGHLKLEESASYQLVNLRSWQLVNSVIENYYIEPDFHYAVVNESGEIDNSVITIDEKGLIKATGKGNAIVLVSYDAINVACAAGGPLFGALWPENTGVFVVSVGETGTNITSNMNINTGLNTTPDANDNLVPKLAGDAVDAELDIFYYLEGEDGYTYHFSPENISSVSIAQALISDNKLSYSGFTPIEANADKSYDVVLKEGRNIVKLTDAEGQSSFQVLSAKKVSYTLNNVSRPNEEVMPGDEVSVVFSTLYHPANKLAGVYNMSAQIYYLDTPFESAVKGGANQYKFASTAASQTITFTIPEDWNTDNDFVLSHGAIRSNGFGDPYGGHREINLEDGKSPNFSAKIRTAYFGSLPEINIHWKKDVTGIELDIVEKTLFPEETVLLTARVNPENADNKNIIWSSSNTEVASVENGLVTALSVGEASISVKTEEGDFIAECSITVIPRPVPVTGISLNEEELSLLPDSIFQLLATINPENADNQNVSWSSSDETIASVDKDGLVKAISSGQTIIKVTTEEGGYSAQCVVNVDITNIEDIQDIAKIYPNPVHDILKIDTHLTGISTVIITDMQGKVVYTKETSAASFDIDCSNWNQGVYFVRVSTDSNHKTYKLLKK